MSDLEELKALTELLSVSLNESVSETFGEFPELIVYAEMADDDVFEINIAFEPIEEEVLASYPENALEEVLSWAKANIEAILSE